MDAELKDLDLAAVLAHGRDQLDNLTFYKLVFQALERIAWERSEDPEVYRRSFLALASGFLASVRPELLPQAVAAKNLLLHQRRF